LLPDARARASAWRTICSNWLALLRKDGTVTEPEGYGDWRSLELAIKDAAKKAARLAGPGVSAATVDAQIRQARYDRFLSRVFARGEQSEWLLKGGMSMLARVPRARTTKDVDLAALHMADLADAEAALTSLVAVNLSDHLTFRLVRSMPTGLGDNQPESPPDATSLRASTWTRTTRSTPSRST
jgi:hypothetical protein